MLCWKIVKIRRFYVLSTYFCTGKYGLCPEKYAPCSGVRVCTGQVRTEYVLSTYFGNHLKIL